MKTVAKQCLYLVVITSLSQHFVCIWMITILSAQSSIFFTSAVQKMHFICMMILNLLSEWWLLSSNFSTKIWSWWISRWIPKTTFLFARSQRIYTRSHYNFTKSLWSQYRITFNTLIFSFSFVIFNFFSQIQSLLWLLKWVFSVNWFHWSIFKIISCVKMFWDFFLHLKILVRLEDILVLFVLCDCVFET
jgi:hypothetical protein